MVTVAVSGANGRTGARLARRLEADRNVQRIVRFDGVLPGPELKRELQGVDVVVHLGAAHTVAAMLDAASSIAVDRFIYRSSAAVYGAWANNQVPLTEDVPLRPNPGFAFAAEHAEAERLVADWRDDHPSATVAVLRPVPVVAPGNESWESDTLGRPSKLRRGETLPPVQFLHVDDAVSAFTHALEHNLAGTFNVAPDGFISGETARALASSGLTIPLPDRVAWVAERWAWHLGWGGRPPAAVPYLLQPWVVANDRLCATGWQPAFTNEEALVAARKGSWWRELSPKRRQEVALGVASTAAASVGTGIVLAVRAARHRRPS